MIDALSAQSAADELGFKSDVLQAENIGRAIAELADMVNKKADEAQIWDAVGEKADKAVLQAHKEAVNPHNITAQMLGAVEEEVFDVHLNNQSNPHNVTAVQVGAVAAQRVAETLQDDDTSKIPTIQAVKEAISFAGGGDMMRSVYDTNNKATDVFLYVDAKLSDIQVDVPAKTSELVNDSGYITIASVPTKVSQLTNDSNYATQSDVSSAVASKAPAYTYGTADLTASTSQLETGKLYFVYE